MYSAIRNSDNKIWPPSDDGETMFNSKPEFNYFELQVYLYLYITLTAFPSLPYPHNTFIRDDGDGGVPLRSLLVISCPS